MRKVDFNQVEDSISLVDSMLNSEEILITCWRWCWTYDIKAPWWYPINVSWVKQFYYWTRIVRSHYYFHRIRVVLLSRLSSRIKVLLWYFIYWKPTKYYRTLKPSEIYFYRWFTLIWHFLFVLIANKISHLHIMMYVTTRITVIANWRKTGSIFNKKIRFSVEIK